MKNEEGFEKPLPGWGTDENENVIKSEVLGGIFIEKIQVGKTLRIKTKKREYLLEHRDDGFYLSGHPEYCPTPTHVKPHGSTWGGSAIKAGYIGRGMDFEYGIEGMGTYKTSEIVDVEIVGEEPSVSPEDQSSE
jgi:hypothetical protein